ncbi:hypothetical protein HPB48_016216 [Haemaphysalis longicornis]|uniref:Uncharacterized protein n=1 Tax=Haemaphysalis longicornis TaxID=44386 RepID=A0A9J6GRY6_HAELO|nr:hypothetical protein HPB48_016216 [Haemaphysalis longicornis]
MAPCSKASEGYNTLEWIAQSVQRAVTSVVPIGMCTARIEIRGVTFTGCFVVLHELLKAAYTRPGLPSRVRRNNKPTGAGCPIFRPTNAVRREGSVRSALRICEDNVTLSPQASMFVTVECQRAPANCGIVEQNVSLLLARQVCAARGPLVDLIKGRTEILLTNFSAEHQHLPFHTAVPLLRRSQRWSQATQFSGVIHLNSCLKNYKG